MPHHCVLVGPAQVYVHSPGPSRVYKAIAFLGFFSAVYASSACGADVRAALRR